MRWTEQTSDRATDRRKTTVNLNNVKVFLLAILWRKRFAGLRMQSTLRYPANVKLSEQIP